MNCQYLISLSSSLFGVRDPKDLTYLAFQAIDSECSRGRLFMKRVGSTKFNMYVFITLIWAISSCGYYPPSSQFLLYIFIFEIYSS
jgi:hypothetical protein